MPPKTILYMTPSVRLLGARQSLLGLVRNLDPERYRPVVCCQTRGDLTDEMEKSGIEVLYVKTGWWRKAKYWPHIPIAIARLRNYIRKSEAALVHCNEIYPTPFAVIAGRLTGIPVVSHMRLTVTPRLIRNYWLHRTARVIVVSEAAGRDFDVWPDRQKRVTVIYNGVDAEEFSTDRPREEFRSNLGLPAKEFLIGLVATWAHRKRQHVAVEALSLIRERAPHARLLLVGGANEHQKTYERELRALIEDKGLADRVTLLPFIRDIAPVYHAIDVNLLISGEEGFGRAIIEAGAAGRPSIGARAGGIPELIRDGINGWLIPVDDPRALAECLVDLAENPEKIERAAVQARLDVLKRFTIEAHAQRVMSLYDDILNPRPAGATSQTGAFRHVRKV